MPLIADPGKLLATRRAGSRVWHLGIQGRVNGYRRHLCPSSTWWDGEETKPLEPGMRVCGRCAKRAALRSNEPARGAP